MGFAVVTLKKGEGRLLKSGGMWIFDNEIDTIMGTPLQPISPVSLFSRIFP